jgi:hypothetical protein
MADLSCPAFIDEAAWEAATKGQRQDWATYARELADLANDAKFQRVVGRWIDEFCGVFASTIDPSECANPGHVALMTLREGARQPGIKIMQHLQAVAPTFWMRLLQELRNMRTRVQHEETDK